MQLEELEQKTLAYLKQASNPLVTLSTLLRHLNTEAPHSRIQLQELKDFLVTHDLFKVIEPLSGASDPQTDQSLAEAGFLTEPCVLLETRIPSRRQVLEMILSQMNDMNEALAAALVQAREDEDTVRAGKIRATLERSSKLMRNVQAEIAGIESQGQNDARSNDAPLN